MRKVFVTDLDGTLLRSDQTLSEFTTTVLNRAITDGHIVSFATARGLASAYAVVSNIMWKHPVILYNGALLYDAASQRVIDGYFLDNDLTNELLHRGRGFGVTPFYFLLDDGDNERVYHEKLTSYGMMEFLNNRRNDPRFRVVGKVKSSAGERSLVLTYIGELDVLAPLQTEIKSAYGDNISIHMMKDYYIPNQYFLEFSHPRASKREGLILWAKHMGVDTGDICIFGDHLNDVGLFEVGGKKVAVSSAHEDILSMADLVVESNDEDGVAKFIFSSMNKDDGRFL